jgi:hypothetical protein
MPALPRSQGPNCGRLFRNGVTLALIFAALLTSEMAATADLIDQTVFQLMKPPVEKSPHTPSEWKLSGTNKPLPAVFYRSSFPKWKRYADERVEFDYPDDPALTLELIDRESKKRVPIAGSPVRTVSYKPEMIYRIHSDGITWAVLVWSEDEWLDDGICLCGAVVLRTYLVHQGGFYVFSFLEDGKVKQVQCLGEKSRLILFESTHLPMAQSDYVRIGQSLMVKKPIQRTAAELQSETIQRYKFAGRLGWLRVGMPVNEIELLLGPPTSRRFNARIYEKADNEWLVTWRLPIKSGKLQLLPDNFVKSRELPPKEGTLRWFGKKLGQVKDVDGDVPRKTPRGGWQRSFFEAFVREAPHSSAEDWGWWCQYAHDMFDKGFADSRIVSIVKARFLEPIQQHHARWILDDYDNVGNQELFKQRLNLCVQAADKTLMEARNENDVRWSPFSVWDDVHNLLSGIRRAERNLLLPRLLEHPHPNIRSDAYYFLDVMPEPQRTAYARIGLNDQDSQVRAWAASAITKGAGSQEDIPKLKKLLADDKDYYVQENVKEAIASLEKRP